MTKNEEHEIREIESIRERERRNAGPPNAMRVGNWKVLASSLALAVVVLAILYFLWPR